MQFPLAPRSMTDDLELQVRIFGEFHKISQIWDEAASAKQMKILVVSAKAL